MKSNTSDRLFLSLVAVAHSRSGAGGEAVDEEIELAG